MSHPHEATLKNLPMGQGVQVLVCDEHGLLALEKPTGTRAHPNDSSADPNALLTVPYDHDAECYLWDHAGQRRLIYLVNRLDSPTSGVILLALSKPVADAAKAVFKTHRARKTYYAIVRGRPPVAHGTWRDTLTKQRKGETVRVGPGKVLSAKTEFRTLKHWQYASSELGLLRLSPLTGRTHQLRIQCKIHRHPILGDQTYGDFGMNRRLLQGAVEDRLYLHSGKTELSYILFDKVQTFSAQSPLPASFERLIEVKPAGLRSINPTPVKKLSPGLARRRFRH